MPGPFDDLTALFADMQPLDADRAAKLRDQLSQKPFAVDAGLGALAIQLAVTQGKDMPSMDQMHLCLFATTYDKGAPKEAISAFRDSASRGGAPVNLLCVDDGLGLRIMDLAVDLPHKPFTWSEQDTVAACAYGMEATATGGDILGVADLGFGNIAFALAVAVLVRRTLEDVDDLLASVEEPVRQQAAALIAAVPNDITPLEALRQVGGRDIAAALGAIAASRAMNMPLVVEGPGVLSALIIAEALSPVALDHVILAGCSTAFEEKLSTRLNLNPMVGMPLGAGPGCALALSARTLKAACQIMGLR